MGQTDGSTDEKSSRQSDNANTYLYYMYYMWGTYNFFRLFFRHFFRLFFEFFDFFCPTLFFDNYFFHFFPIFFRFFSNWAQKKKLEATKKKLAQKKYFFRHFFRHFWRCAAANPSERPALLVRTLLGQIFYELWTPNFTKSLRKISKMLRLP